MYDKNAVKKYYEKNKDKIKKWNNEYHLIKDYGISKHERDAMHTAQAGCCAICGTYKDMLCVDHNHATGSIRAMLCHACNRTLGIVEADIDNIHRMIAYIDKYK